MDSDTLFLAKTYFIRGWSLPAIVRHLRLTPPEREELTEYLCDAYGDACVFPPEYKALRPAVVAA
jgi:hypothetical protein